MPGSAPPLRGLMAVEFSSSVAGRFAGQVLADLGAEVYKTENPEGGDGARPTIRTGSPTLGDRTGDLDPYRKKEN